MISLVSSLFGLEPSPVDHNLGISIHSFRSVLEKYGIRKFHLVAHSMGCTIALALAGQDPAAVNSITILAPVRCFSSH